MQERRNDEFEGIRNHDYFLFVCLFGRLFVFMSLHVRVLRGKVTFRCMSTRVGRVTLKMYFTTDYRIHALKCNMKCIVRLLKVRSVF